MSQWTFDDDEQEQQQEQPAKGNGLREHLKRLEAENKQLKEQNSKYGAQLRKQAVTGVITSKGYDPRIAAFIPADVDSTPEAVETWLKEYGDLFGGAKASSAPEGDDEGDEAAEAELAAAFGRMGRATAAGKVAATKEADLMARLSDPSLTQDQLMDLIASAGATG